MIAIGSIVYLKGGSQKLMILNRGPIINQNGTKMIFDYSACRYPVGLIEDEIFYFNEENVERTIFEGYVDNDDERFQELYHEMIDDLDSDIVRGEVNPTSFGLE